MEHTPTICPSCDAGAPTSVVTECDCSPEERLSAAAPALLDMTQRLAIVAEVMEGIEEAAPIFDWPEIRTLARAAIEAARVTA